MPQAKAQRATKRDPVTFDPDHYKVESENEHVRVLRVRYGPKAKSVMHSHPACVAIFLTDTRCRFTYPDGKTEDHQNRTPASVTNTPWCLVIRSGSLVNLVNVVRD